LQGAIFIDDDGRINRCLLKRSRVLRIEAPSGMLSGSCSALSTSSVVPFDDQGKVSNHHDDHNDGERLGVGSDDGIKADPLLDPLCNCGSAERSLPASPPFARPQGSGSGPSQVPVQRALRYCRQRQTARAAHGARKRWLVRT
jgi:hypothetical protein